ncbi:thioredoxin-dependent thiol peroxidase [Candidatus Woesearchaeota archaeon]|nr:thioredoxin-dependent thiol peroxidase [Candidatus Woesearchaeota archaeon]
MELKIGDKAPDFKLKDDQGNIVKLSDFKGKKVVLYFYPKDMTPGCTTEAICFRDDISLFNKNKVEVIGISLDNEDSHKKFKEKHNLPFKLLADVNAEASKKYGSYKLKNMYGRQFYGIARTTFLIDENQKIKHIFNNVKAENHSKEVLNKFI